MRSDGPFTVMCSLELKKNMEPLPLRIWPLSYSNVHNSRITLYTAMCVWKYFLLYVWCAFMCNYPSQ